MIIKGQLYEPSMKIQNGLRSTKVYDKAVYLFNLCSENISRKASLDELGHGVRIGGRNITNLRYADDTTLLDEAEDHKILLTKVKDENEKPGLRLFVKKTKAMVIVGELGEARTADETFEVVDSFTFLSARIDRDGGCSSKIARRIAMGKAAMTGLYRVMKDRARSAPTKDRLVKALALLYLCMFVRAGQLGKARERKLMLLNCGVRGDC